jgi:hypothetical protein
MGWDGRRSPSQFETTLLPRYVTNQIVFPGEIQFASRLVNSV